MINRESGFSLLETIIGMAILSISIVVTMQLLISTQSGMERTDARGQMTDQARLAVENLARQIRSGNVLYDPMTEGTNAGTNPDGSAIPAGFSLRIYTQANGVERCVQWRVLNTGSLQSRSWSQSWQTDNNVSSWREVANSVVNPSSQPPFSLDPSAGFGGSGNSRLVDVDLVVKAADTPTNQMEIKDSMSGRNTQYFSINSGLCGVIPTP
ncbi:MAG: PilW family protein [Actinomycetota bacterium]